MKQHDNNQIIKNIYKPYSKLIIYNIVYNKLKKHVL